MNKKTLLKLKNNPFFKMTDEQKLQLLEIEESEPVAKVQQVIEFGDLNRHNSSISIHDTNQTKKKRTKKGK